MLFLLIVVTAIMFLAQLPPVQTWAAKKAASYLSNELKTKVEVKSLYLKPFKSLVLEGLYVQDLQNDTLLSVPKLVVDISVFSPFKNRKIAINYIELQDAKFNLKKFKDSSSNLSFIINYFDSGKSDTTKARPFDLTFNKVSIKNLDFRYKNYLFKNIFSHQVNYEDVHLMQLNVGLVGLDIKNHLFKAQINKLSFKEKCGFVLNDLSTLAVIDSNKIVLNGLQLITPKSNLHNFFSMQFKSFDDFDNFENKVTMEGNFKDATIASTDVAYFSSALSKMNVSIKVDGKIKGKVKNLKAKDLQIMAGKATYLKGDFNVKGLPELKNTFLELKFNQVATNKTDLDAIIASVTGQKKSILPSLIGKLGNVNYKGDFIGFTNNFKVIGDFKTKLGKLKSDVRISFDKSEIPSYVGNIQTLDFDIGQLLDQKTLGKTSFKADINGRGIEVKKLSETVSANIEYFDFNNYRYRNIKLKGQFEQQIFNGKITVNDENLKLNFNGNFNLNPQLPEFKFYANIENANLRILNFTKDTINVATEFNTTFSGTGLDNVQGNVFLNKIKLSTADKSFIIDSVSVNANGLGANRLLALTSDIGDASIRGQYDLNTLPSAFKIIVKKYIPSINTVIVKANKQNFQFNFDLKNLDALTSFFLPTLSIPERGNFNGKFNSDSGLVSLTGFVKTIKYDKIVYHNLIIDQNTLPNSLEAIISLDMVNITDSVIVQNVIIQNTLKNDSLSFNVKLSNKNAVNQLDLYGLIEFNKDVTAKLSILPSDIVIDNQVWKVQDKARIKFEDTKTIIEGFNLINNQQLVAVNGIISSNPDDLLAIVLENVSMKSFSTLSKGSGINISGIINGNINLASVLGIPDIKSDLKIDSLQYNTTFIGDLLLSSQFNNDTKKIDIKAVVDNRGLKTMDINGSINIKSETNNLDLNVILDKTEIIIFDPFVKDLVSKLSGQISSNLKVTGQFKNPKINGTAGLINAGLTVNYLNTAYTINDNVDVENSVIKINNLGIKDTRNNIARVNGTVDLNNLDNPDIEINVNASNFMALNTTVKNGQPYYGTAYTTGDFNFNGPTDAMRIVINAKTEKGTTFTIPLNAASTIGTNDFIFYVSKDTLRNKRGDENFFKGLVMEFELRVDEESQVNILTEVGNLIGAGNGDFRLLITSLGDFEMYGDYVIDNGKFDFTANNVINKTFEIQKGGDIRWTGDPSNANINLNAIYATRTPLAPLYLAAGQTQTDDRRNETVLAHAVMFLSGSLLTPEIKFKLDFPNNTDIKTRLGGYLNNQDNENQQVINLVVRNSFSGNASGGIGFQNSDLISSASELAFSKLNNIISQSLKVKNLDFNIRSGNEFGGTYRFLNDRFTVRGNFSNNRYSAINNNNVINNNLFNTPLTDVTRDLEFNYNLKKDATFVAKGFQRPANRDFFNLNRDIYINGLGLVYMQEYDTFAEFLQNTFKRKSKAIDKNKSSVKKENIKKP